MIRSWWAVVTGLLVGGVLGVLIVGWVRRATWWKPWGRVLGHPTDPVVAAALVLLGAFITVVSTQVIGVLTRRHEMEKALQDRLFEPRAKVYVASFAFLQDKGLNKTAEEQQTLAAELLLYGSERASELWLAANKAYRKSQDAPGDTQLKEASRTAFRAYIAQTQTEVGIRQNK